MELKDLRESSGYKAIESKALSNVFRVFEVKYYDIVQVAHNFGNRIKLLAPFSG